MSLVDKILEMQPDSISKLYKEMHKSLNTKLDSLSNLFINPENVKGIQRNPDQLNSMIFGAREYINSSWPVPGANAILALEHAKTKTNRASEAVRRFDEESWKEYKDKVSKLNMIIFKE